MWFFPTAKIRAKPAGIVIVGPARIGADAERPISKWMQSSGCTLGLGDGTGMNLYARLQGVSRILVQAFTKSNGQNAQPKRISA